MVDKKIIVYSCVTGNYEKPVVHKEISDDIKYIFFTDSYENVPDGWVMQPINGLDNFSDKKREDNTKFDPFEPPVDTSLLHTSDLNAEAVKLGTRISFMILTSLLFNILRDCKAKFSP